MTVDNKNSGYIKIYRSLINKPYFTEHQYVVLWIYLLIRANFKDSEVFFNGKITTVSRGSFITSRKKLAESTGIQESKIERILFFLKTEQQIEQVKKGRSRLISILNYEKYQESEQINEQDLNRKRTGFEQVLNTDKKEKELKESKEVNIYSEFLRCFNIEKGSSHRGDAKSRKSFSARLKEGYTPDEMIAALKKAMTLDYHKGNGFQDLTPEFITRPDKLEKYMNGNIVKKSGQGALGLSEEQLKNMSESK